MKTNELTGQLLDCWVAKAIDPKEKIFIEPDGSFVVRWRNKPRPYSTAWAHGGPLIDKYEITFYGNSLSVAGKRSTWIVACVAHGKTFNDKNAYGLHEIYGEHLPAAMRAIVASVFGETVGEVAQ